MSLHEKTSWFNLVVLMLTLIFYIILFIAGDIIINLNTSLALFFSVCLIGILCNFGFIIFYKRSMDPAVNLNEPDTGTEKKTRVYPYVLYWGAFVGILIGTSLWLLGLSNGLISKNVNVLIIFSSLLMGILFTVFIHKYKKMRGDSLEPGDNCSAKDIAMQRALIGYDERDLHIRKTARRISLIAIFTVLIFGLLIVIFWAYNHFGTFMLSINLLYIYLIIAGVMFFRHIVIQTATIIQYRMGS